MPKFALIVLLGRLIPPRKWIRYSLWIFAILNQGSIMASSLMWFTRCSPTVAKWESSVPGAVRGSIEPLEMLSWVTSATSAALDLLFALFPIPFIMKLNMSLRRRVSISAALALGGVACAVSIYEMTVIPGLIAELPTDPTCKS